MGSGPTFPVAAYSRVWRTVAGAAFVASRVCLPAILFVLLTSHLPTDATTVVRWFAMFFGPPALAAVAIPRAFAATLRLSEDEMTIERSGIRIDVPRKAITAVTPWRLPVPSPGLTVTLASGRRLAHVIAIGDPLPVLRALTPHGVEAESAGEQPSVAYAHARAEHGLWRWTHLLLRFPIFALLPTAPLFNVHQHIAYGGLFGQYYMLGLRPYLATFALYWATVTVYLVLYASIWRGPAELICLLAAAVAPSRAARVRRATERLLRVLYYAGVPVLLALRFAPW